MKSANISENAEITLVSKRNHNTYYLFSDKIVVRDNENDKSIALPDENGIICFYDMYYSQGELYVICIAEGYYDLAYILNEGKLSLEKRNLHK